MPKPKNNTPCSRDGCARLTVARGMCKKHYAAWHARAMREASPDLQSAHPCTIAGCGGTALSRSLCQKHYARWRAHGDPMKTLKDRGHAPICSIAGCARPYSGRGYCALHYRRWRDFGNALHEGATRRGEQWRNPFGYFVVRRKDHPNAICNGTILVHRLVMSEKLGRPLRTGENVHHLNGDRGDNSPENLQLWTKRQPSGQRVWDLFVWCLQFVARYEHEIDLHCPPGETLPRRGGSRPGRDRDTAPVAAT